jgi:hypothetical protein
MKKQSLSGIFFRYHNPDSAQWENWCFEDLPVEEQSRIMGTKDRVWVESLAKAMAKALRVLGGKLNENHIMPRRPLVSCECERNETERVKHG